MRDFIDLTGDEDEQTAQPAKPSDGGARAVTTTAAAIATAATVERIPRTQRADSPEEKLTFSSHEIKALSATRTAHTRLPDLLQLDQKQNIINASHPEIYLGYIQEHEESSAPLSIVYDDNPLSDFCPPADFTYTDGYVLTDSLGKPSRRLNENTVIAKGCNCDNEDGICDPKTCGCYALHEQLAPNPWVEQTKTDEAGQFYTGMSDIRGDFAYSNAGRLRDRVMTWSDVPIWECNANCSCTGDCRNRVVQKGRTVALKLFKSRYTGWGVKAAQRIRPGTFITVYAGELLGWQESERRSLKYEETSTTYCLDIDSHHIKRKLFIEPFIAMCNAEGRAVPEDEDELDKMSQAWAIPLFSDQSLFYSIDAGLWGNLSRFFNHSCDSNLMIYPVYTEQRDLRRPFLAFFARREIEEGEELTFSYGGSLDDADVDPVEKTEIEEQLHSGRAGTELTFKKPEGKQNLTSMKCACGSPKCRGVVFIRGG